MVRTCSAAVQEDVGGVLEEEKLLVEEAQSCWDQRGLRNRDFSILNHRNEEGEVRRAPCLKGPPYQSEVHRVLLGAVSVSITGCFPLFQGGRVLSP